MKKASPYLIVSAALLFALCIHPFGQSEGDVEMLYREIENDRVGHIAFLQQLIQAQRGGEEAVQKIVSKKLEELGCDVETLRIKPTSLEFKYQFAAKNVISRMNVQSMRLPVKPCLKMILPFRGMKLKPSKWRRPDL